MNQNIEELKLLINRHDPTIITLQEVMTVPSLLSSPLNRYNWYTNIYPTIPHHSVAVGILKHIRNPFLLILLFYPTLCYGLMAC